MCGILGTSEADIYRSNLTSTNIGLDVPIQPQYDVTIVPQYVVVNTVGSALSLHQYIQTISYYWEQSFNLVMALPEWYQNDAYPTVLGMTVIPAVNAVTEFNTNAICSGMVQAMLALLYGIGEDSVSCDWVAWDLIPISRPQTKLGSFSVVPLITGLHLGQSQGLLNDTLLSSNSSAHERLANASAAAQSIPAKTTSLGDSSFHVRSTFSSLPMSVKDVLYLFVEAAQQIWLHTAEDELRDFGTVLQVSRPRRGVSLEVFILQSWSATASPIQWKDIAWCLKWGLLAHVATQQYEGMTHALVNARGQAVAHLVYWRGPRPAELMQQGNSTDITATS